MNGTYNELIPITPKEMLKYAVTTSNEVYIIKLDDKRYIYLFQSNDEWSFQLREIPTLNDENDAIFSGRKLRYMIEVQELYRALMGYEMPEL